jgi:long-chain acyl-CoA synthetase
LIATGATIGYAGSLDALTFDLAAIRPTVMTTVPRILEKLYVRIQEGMQHRTALERRLFDWGMAIGRQHHIEGGGDGTTYALADRLVLQRLRARLGGRLRLLVCGGAPMDRHVGEFFHSTGITVCEGYGLTETSPVATMNVPGGVRFGTVGQALPGVEIRLTDEGEICVKGPNVMLGYYRDAAATAEAIDGDGWFHSGDIGVLDADGFLSITDRKKELIVLSNGKKVAPQAVECLLLASPFVDQILIAGEGHAFLSALIVPDFTHLNPWAYERGLPLDRQSLVRQEHVRALFRSEIERLSRDLAPFERVKQFTLLARDWSIDSGEQTPTLKLRRQIILGNHADEIAAMYPATGEVVSS